MLMKRVKDFQGQVDQEMGVLKTQVVAASAIESTHTKLVKQMEVFLTELREREQTQIEEEEEVRMGADNEIENGRLYDVDWEWESA